MTWMQSTSEATLCRKSSHAVSPCTKVNVNTIFRQLQHSIAYQNTRRDPVFYDWHLFPVSAWVCQCLSRDSRWQETQYVNSEFNYMIDSAYIETRYCITSTGGGINDVHCGNANWVHCFNALPTSENSYDTRRWNELSNLRMSSRLDQEKGSTGLR